MGKQGEQFVIILDIARIFSMEELSMAQELSADESLQSVEQVAVAEE